MILQAELTIEGSVYYAGCWSDLTTEVWKFMKNQDKMRGHCTVEWVVKSKHPVQVPELMRQLVPMTDCLVEAPSQIKEFDLKIEKSTSDNDIIGFIIKEID
jgi:hypothetical protein